MNYRALLATLPPEVGWEVGDDEEHPGRFYAEAHWDDPVNRIHQSLRYVNEPTLLAAVRILVADLPAAMARD